MLRESEAPLSKPIGLALFLVVLFVYLLTGAGHLQTEDVGSELAVAQSLLAHGTFAVPSVNPEVPGLHGYYFSAHGIGESLLLLPAALAGELVSHAHSHLVTAFVGSLINPITAALTTGVLYALVVDLGVGVMAAVIVALLFSFTTIEWPYAHDAFDVTPTGLCLLGALFGLHRYTKRSERRWLFLSGCALTFGVLLRLPSLLCLPVFGLYLLISGRPFRCRDQAITMVVWTSPVALTLLFIVWYNWVRFGDPMQTGAGFDGHIEHPLLSLVPSFFPTPLLYGVLGLLVSPGKSLFLFSPILLLSLIGLPWFMRYHRALSLTVAGVVLVNILFYGKFVDWSGDFAWGPRYMVPLTALLFLPVAGVIATWRRWPLVVRVAAVILAIGSLGIQIIGVTVDYETQLELTLRFEYWTPQYSQLVVQSHSFWQILLHGSAPFPSRLIKGAISRDRPPINTWDFWWVYAWLIGISHRLVAVLVVGEAVCAAAAGTWLVLLLRDVGWGESRVANSADEAPARRGAGLAL